MGLTEQTSYTGSRADLIETLRDRERKCRKAKQAGAAEGLAEARRIIENWTEEPWGPPTHDRLKGLVEDPAPGTWQGASNTTDGGGGSGA